MKLSVVLPFALLQIVFSSSVFSQGNSLLWKISGKGLTSPSFLYGTMHLHDKRVFHFSDSVSSALESSDAFAMEIILDDEVHQRIMHSIFMDSTYTLKKLLTKEQYDSADSYCQKELGISIDLYNHMKPIFIILLFNQEEEMIHEGEDRNSYFLDQYLQIHAQSQLKTIHGLETPEEQLNAFDFMSMEDQATLLMRSIRFPKEDSAGMERMLKYYVENDLYNMMKFENDFSLPDSLFRQLITMRNWRMAERIDSIIRLHSTFIAIGAGHLGGETGLVNLLRDRGYSVLPVLPTYNNYLTDGWYRFTSVRNKFTIDFPGYPEIIQHKKSDAEISLYKYSAEDGSIAVGFINGNQEVSQDSLASYFDWAVQTAVGSYRESGSVHKKTLSDRQAMERDVELADGNKGELIVLDQKNPVCFLLVTGNKSFIKNEVSRIVDSLKILF